MISEDGNSPGPKVFWDLRNRIASLESSLEGMKKRNEDLELKLEISNQKLDAFRHVYMENRELKERLKTAEDKLVDWKSNAHRFGETMSTVGPKGYYEFTPDEWYDWMVKTRKEQWKERP